MRYVWNDTRSFNYVVFHHLPDTMPLTDYINLSKIHPFPFVVPNTCFPMTFSRSILSELNFAH